METAPGGTHIQLTDVLADETSIALAQLGLRDMASVTEECISKII